MAMLIVQLRVKDYRKWRRVYDVQALDTPYRIISFIVLGVILLSVSFAYKKNKEKITAFIAGEDAIR